MSYVITKSPTLGLAVVRPYIFKDYRGEYTETYNRDDVLRGVTFVQDSAIRSRKGVLRGYHGDDRTTKLITCMYGSFQIVVVCIDPTDSRFMLSETFLLDDKEKLSLVVPPLFINAHQCLTDECIFFYKQDTFYLGEKHQYTIKWDALPSVHWPIEPILSYRDREKSRFVFEYMQDDKLLPPEGVN